MKQKLLVITKVVSISFASVLSLLFFMSWLSPDRTGAVRVIAASEDAPSVTAMTPHAAPNDLDTPIIISGTGFTAGLSGTLVITLPTVALNNIPLVDVGWISSTQLTATVPWGLNSGVYTMTVTNPNGQSGSLTRAFSVTQGIDVWATGGPYGGAVTMLLINPLTPTTIYATVQAPSSASGIGLFRSVDSGASWEMIVADIGNQFHAADLSVPAPTVIYVHKWGEGLYRSDDGGDQWITLPFPDPNCFTLRPFAHPENSQIVYVAADCGGSSGGLYKSENRGETWITLTEGLTDTQVTALAFDPGNPQVLYAGTGNGNVFHSVNGGESWAPIGKPDQVISNLAVNPFGSHEPWAAGADSNGHWGYFWKYTGGTWIQVQQGAGQAINATSIVFSPGISATMWVGALQGGLKSTDGGNSWEPFSPSPTSVNALAVDPTDSQIAYLGYSGTGIVQTRDGGISWVEVNQGLTGVYPTGLAIHPNNPAIVYATAHGAGTYKTNNGGGSWLMLPSDNVWPRSPVVDPFNPDRVYIGKTNGVGITENDGLTWNWVMPAPPPLYEDCCRVDVNTLLATAQPGHLVMGVSFSDNSATSFEFVGGGIYTSTDYGESWGYVDVGQVISSVAILTSDPNNPATIYAGTSGNCCDGTGNGVWKSEDGGATWSPAGLSGLQISAIAVDPHNSQIVYATSVAQFYISTNGGTTWTLRATQDYGMSSLLILPTTPATIFEYGWRGVVRSVDGGLHWERAAGSLGYAKIGSMAATTTEGRIVLYVGTAGGAAPQGAQGFASAEDTLVNAGVYRNTIRLFSLRLYLPMVQR